MARYYRSRRRRRRYGRRVFARVNRGGFRL